MKALPLILAALVGGLVAAAAVTFVVPKPAATAQAAPADSPELAGLRDDVRKLRQELETLRTSPQLESSTAARLPVGEIDAAVERALAGRKGQPPAGEAARAAAAPGAEFDAKAAFAELSDPALDWEGHRRKWSELAKAGKLDEVLALYEKAATDNPNDAKAQTALGQAYLNKLFNSPQGPEAGIWGTKADKAFDHALAIDDHNWEARYTKAVSLSNWPAFLGKQPEAIHNFEVLVQQQSEGPVQPEYASTYLILGNLYQQTGKVDKALAIWQQGQSLFPDQQQFQQKIQLAQQQH